MNMMEYEGYIAEIDYDDTTENFSGIVVNTRATLHFVGQTVVELKAAFRETITDYRAWCTAEGASPEEPGPAHILVSLDPDLQRRVLKAAGASDRTLTEFVRDAVERAA